jgi:hypothetical protein
MLSEETQREPSPIAATTHVKVIEVPDSPDAIEGQTLVKAKAPIAEFVAARQGGGDGPVGFHIRSVPISEPEVSENTTMPI